MYTQSFLYISCEEFVAFVVTPTFQGVSQTSVSLQGPSLQATALQLELQESGREGEEGGEGGATACAERIVAEQKLPHRGPRLAAGGGGEVVVVGGRL